MERDELMKPRYKVVADWPEENNVEVGELLELEDDGLLSYTTSRCLVLVDPKNYPHLFRKLEWWEERKPEDMPEYVKDEHTVFKVSFAMQPYRNRQVMVMSFPNEHPYHVNEHVMPFYEPATEAEYIAFTTPAPSAD